MEKRVSRRDYLVGKGRLSQEPIKDSKPLELVDDRASRKREGIEIKRIVYVGSEFDRMGIGSIVHQWDDSIFVGCIEDPANLPLNCNPFMTSDIPDVLIIYQGLAGKSLDLMKEEGIQKPVIIHRGEDEAEERFEAPPGVEITYFTQRTNFPEDYDVDDDVFLQDMWGSLIPVLERMRKSK